MDRRRGRRPITALEFWLGLVISLGGGWAVLDRALDKLVRWPAQVDSKITTLTETANEMKAVADMLVQSKQDTALRFQTVEAEVRRIDARLSEVSVSRQSSRPVPVLSSPGSTIR